MLIFIPVIKLKLKKTGMQKDNLVYLGFRNGFNSRKYGALQVPR